MSDEPLAVSMRWCYDVTKRNARNFFYGMKLTPEPKRSAMYAVYAFMRACDDLADEVDSSLDELEVFREQMQRVVDGGAPGSELPQYKLLWPAFAHVCGEYQLDGPLLHAMLDGQRSDFTTTAIATFDELYQYCYRVASVVGLVCIRIWGHDGDPAVEKLAEERGIALQITNILRDVVEDADRGRVYLPWDDMDRFGITRDDILAHRPGDGFNELIAFQAARARDYYEQSAPLEAHLTRSCRAACGAITQIYRGLLDKIIERPGRVLDERVRLNTPRKIGIALLVASGCARELPQAVTTQSDHPNLKAVVIGGGVAGIAAAVRLAQSGARVTLVETSKRLGGRATSFVDPDTGELLDNCQHVLMRCCTCLLDLYQRLGVDQHIEWHRRFHFLDGDGNLDTLEGDDLPAPFHLTRSMMAFRTFSVMDKLAIGRAMMSLLRIDRTRWHDRSFADWLAATGQTPATIERFWSPVIVSAINEWPDRCAADYGMQVFQDGFLATRDAYEMGLATVPLMRLYDPAEQVIGDVRLGTSAERFIFDGGRIKSLQLVGGETLEADVFISALPFDRLAKLCSPDMVDADARLRPLDQFQVNPILGVHLWFDREVMDIPHLALTTGKLQWVFNKAGGYLHGVISGAHDLVDTPAEAIAAICEAELAAKLPTMRGAKRIGAKVIKEKRATFSLVPGIDRIRPTATGAIDNLLLAGDWCATGWPATMEGAARSGYMAAQAAMRPVVSIA
jgi:zeta-carotene desaturase